MYKHYISIDNRGRIIDGFTTAQREPHAEDIFLHEGGAVFELFGKDPGRDLFVPANGIEVPLYAYEGEKPRYRSTAELKADIPDVTPPPSTAQRLEDAEADIETLAMAMTVAFGGKI